MCDWMRLRWVACSNFCEGRGRVSARQPRYFLLLRHQVPKEKATGLSASLRFSPGKPACCRRSQTGESGIGRPERVMTELASSAYADFGSCYQFGKESLVLPLVPTPATAASCGAQLHRRVQLHRHHFYGDVFERSALARSEFCRTATRG